MELGARLRQARLEVGLSQRQLCGDVITRNMLSQIENGNAKPSMDTLRYLAARLGKPMGYFLEEHTVSPNQQTVLSAREAYLRGDWEACQEILSQYQVPDPVFDPVVHLGERYSEMECLNIAGRLDGDRVSLDEIPPYSFAGFTVRK